MRILLDTHAFLYWIMDSDRLSRRAREVFLDSGSELLWSAASSWEVSIKYALGRLELAKPPKEIFPEQLRRQRIGSLPVEHSHAFRVAELPLHHRDPFDRLLVAQAQVERVPILSRDQALRDYDVEVIW
jgi:PIN domain nuclease of toxin-antitoxin system